MVYRALARGPSGAALVFRVGQADETLPRRGLTHLAEHLALSPAHRWSGVNGEVDLLATTLWFEGEPGRVAEQLHAAAAALHDPQADRLAVERRVLAVESGGGGPEAVLLDLLYGARGPGLAAYEEFGLRSVGTADLVAHARHWFCQGNAALVLVGDFDDGAADLPLPAGPRRPPANCPPRLLERPAEVPQPGSPLALGAPIADGAAASMLAMLLERRVWGALRHERGLAYDVRCRLRWVNGHERLLALTTDVEARDASPAAQVLVEQVRRLAAGDFTAEDLDDAFRVVEETLDPAPSIGPLTVAAAGELVRGRAKLPRQTLEEWHAVTPESVAEAATMLAERMVLACPEGATSSLLPAVDLHAGDAVDGRRFAARIVPRHLAAFDVVVGDEGASLLLPDDAMATVRFATCVAAVRGIDGGLTLVDESGQALTLDPRDLRDGAEAVAAVEARLDPALIVPADERLVRVQDSPGRGLRATMVGDTPELLAEHLGADERLLLTAEAAQGIRGGVLAITERRVLFVGRLLSEHVDDIPLEGIARLRRKPNPLWPALEIEHGRQKSRFTFLTIARMNEVAAAISSARGG